MTPSDIASLLDDRPGDGIFRVERRAFQDPDVFDLEMQYVFEANWVFLGLASQVPAAHDYITTWLGRAPVLISRGADGQVRCFINSCRHKRSTLAHLPSGNARAHTCRYHGWVFDSSGINKLIKSREEGAYSDAFESEDRDLEEIAKFENYRGMLFGTLNPQAPALDAYLGDARAALDLVLDQSPDGIELIPGVVRYTFDANWKFQLENCSDSYHFTSTHPSFLRLAEQRAKSAKETGDIKTVWHNNKPWESAEARLGTFSFEHGHSLLWSSQVNVDTHPMFGQLPELRERVGDVRAKWMLSTRNLTIFPSLQIAENAASQIRIMRPLSSTRTEMITYCFAPIGEKAAARAQRIRQYEDFFNPSGLATPDDTVIYEDCQQGYAAPTLRWQLGYMRGIAAISREPNGYARELDIQPIAAVDGPVPLYDETLMHATYRAWHRQLVQGSQLESALRAKDLA